MAWHAMQAQHKSLWPPLHHKQTQTYTWDGFPRWKSPPREGLPLVEWGLWACVCVREYFAHMCVEPQTRAGASCSLHLVAHKGRQTPQASGSKRQRERRGSEGLRGTLSSCWPPDYCSSLGIKLWYWVQSDRMEPSPLGAPHVLNTWGLKEVCYTAMLSSQIISLPVESQDQRIDMKTLGIIWTVFCSKIQVFELKHSIANWVFTFLTKLYEILLIIIIIIIFFYKVIGKV